MSLSVYTWLNRLKGLKGTRRLQVLYKADCLPVVATVVEWVRVRTEVEV